MFTGIIQKIGKVKSKTLHSKGAVFEFSAVDFDFSIIKIGDSISVNGVCLTAVKVNSNYFKADLSQETLNCSTFEFLQTTDRVNLEKALRFNQGIDGHLVSGHVDGVAKVIDILTEGESIRFKIKAPENLVKYIAKKSSVCINGVSLTINDINANVFDVNVVSHTLLVTTLSELKIGTKVNLEVDMIARHIEQLLNKT